MNKLNELVYLISKHNRLYWNGVPEISDAVYDNLLHQLRDIDPEHPLVNEVGGERGDYIHTTPMLSLAKAYTIDEVIKWAKKTKSTDFLVMPKYDGIAGKLENGRLSTRGDGKCGKDISIHIPYISFEEDSSEGLGEIVIPRSCKPKDASGKPYKNLRNAVAGIMNSREHWDHGAEVWFVPYTFNRIIVQLDNLATAVKTCAEAYQNKSHYPTDGVVIKAIGAEHLGCTDHHPRHSIAYKWEDPTTITTVIDITWSMGKDKLTPVALLYPVELSGSTIKRVTLHSLATLNKLDVHIGDKVVIKKRGSVIPQIVDVIPGEHRQSGIVVQCPFCGELLEFKGKHLVCNNVSGCLELKAVRLLDEAKKAKIKGYGLAKIRKMLLSHKGLSLKDL